MSGRLTENGLTFQKPCKAEPRNLAHDIRHAGLSEANLRVIYTCERIKPLGIAPLIPTYIASRWVEARNQKHKTQSCIKCWSRRLWGIK
jgi:hypothetical protein